MGVAPVLRWTLDANLTQASPVKDHDGHLIAGFGDRLSALGKSFETRQNKAGECSIVGRFLERQAVAALQIFQGDRALDQQRPVGQFLHGLFLVDTTQPPAVLRQLEDIKNFGGFGQPAQENGAILAANTDALSKWAQ